MPKSGNEVTSIGAGLLKAMQRYPHKIAQVSFAAFVSKFASAQFFGSAFQDFEFALG